MCIKAILKADVVFAWIDKPGVYGTIFELGVACQAGKEIWIAGPHVNREHWLFREAASLVDTENKTSARDALNALVARRVSSAYIRGAKP